MRLTFAPPSSEQIAAAARVLARALVERAVADVLGAPATAESDDEERVE